MARNWLFLTILGFTLGGSLIFLIWWTYHKFILNRAAADMPKWKSATIRSRFPFWRNRSVQKEYELVSRHEV